MKRYHHLYILLAVVLLCGISLSCDETNPWGDTPPAEVPANGTVDFGIQLGGDSIDISAPITIDRPSDTLSITIGQQSSYTDPDGTVFTCQPRATITLYSLADTIHAEDIAALTIVAGATATTEQIGSNPVLHTAKQTFTIGGQELALDLGYEVYTYTNSQSSTVEMPYIRTGAATEPTVSLSSLSLTRASIVDSTLFEVSAKFNLELESVNTKNENKETLEFNVNYVGVVENVTELYGSVVYTINDKNGEVKSPFVVNGSDSLLLEIKEKSTYATPDTSVYAFEPLATISLKAKSDTAFVEKLELLETLVETGEPTSSRSGENPVSHLYQQLFATSSQEFLFETMYEVYTTQDGDEMPYLMIGEPRCTGIEVTAQKKDATTRGVVYDTVYYDVKAKFEVELKGVNVSDELANTLEFEVNYVGGVINATEVVELVNITYRKNQVFYEGHDNLIPRSQCEVYRDRHYSDGHVETDEFFGAPWFWVESNVSLSSGNDEVSGRVDTTVTYLPDFTVSYENFNQYIIKTDNIYVHSRGATCISSFENVELALEREFNDVPGRYDETYDAELEDYYFNPDSPIEGWYVKGFGKSCRKLLQYVKDGNSIPFRGHLVSMRYYDRFLCVDDTIIGFEEFRPKIESFETFDDYGGSDVHGPGKIYQYVTKGEYLDHTFYFEITDTIYTPKGTVIEKDDRNISVTLDEPTDVTYGKSTLHARVEGHEGEVFSGYGFNVLLPHTGKWVFFEADNVSEDGSSFSATASELELGELHQYYAQVRVPVTLSADPIKSDTQTFTTKHISLSTDEAVDLGLSVKWASQNLGSWNIQGSNSTYHQWPATNVVESQLGEGWRLPTAKEAEELLSHCHQEWINYQGRQGLLLAADNGNAIFLPAVGYKSTFSDNNYFNINSGVCFYMTSSEYDADEGYFACINGYTGNIYKASSDICTPIRPVFGQNPENPDVPYEPQPKADFTINLPTEDAVDLGLSVKWASYNMGANVPEEYGEFYSWSPDAVAAAWGSEWRMPTKEEAEELRDNCTFVWGTQNGVEGMYAIGPNGNAIFFPSAYIEYVYMGEWEGKAQYMENSNNPQQGMGEFWTNTQADNGQVDYMYFLHDASIWTRREQGDAKEWAIFAFPNGQKGERRYEKDRLPYIESEHNLDRRKVIRPVRR